MIEINRIFSIACSFLGMSGTNVASPQARMLYFSPSQRTIAFLFFFCDNFLLAGTQALQVMWRMKPGEIHHYQKQYHINDKGYRGADFDANKPHGRTRIIVAGDSTAFGHGVEEPETFVTLTRQHVASRFSQVIGQLPRP